MTANKLLFFAFSFRGTLSASKALVKIKGPEHQSPYCARAKSNIVKAVTGAPAQRALPIKANIEAA